MNGKCALCEREESLTRHHLIPRCRHHNSKNQKDFSREEARQTIGLCRPCHKQIHVIWTEKELEREWNTVEKLRSHPEMDKFLTWIRRRPAGFHCAAYR